MSTGQFVVAQLVLLAVLALSLVSTVVSLGMTVWSWRTPRRARRLKQSLLCFVIALSAYGVGIVLSRSVDFTGQEATAEDWARMRKAMDREDDSASLVSVGDSVPGFSIKTLDGSVFEFADGSESVVLVNFFRTDCGPCLQELPVLQEIYERYGGRDGFRMIAIARDDNAEAIEATRRDRNLTLPMANDAGASVYNLFATESIPRTYLAGRDGTIAFQSRGFIRNDVYDGDRKTLLDALQELIEVD